LALRADPQFAEHLQAETRATTSVEDMLLLSALRKRAMKSGLISPQRSIRIGLVGGHTPHPLSELIAHFLAVCERISWSAEFLIREYDNYVPEIAGDSSRLYEFAPEVIFLLPSIARCRYTGHFTDPRELQEQAARRIVSQILDLCRVAHDRSGAEVVLANFP